MADAGFGIQFSEPGEEQDRSLVDAPVTLPDSGLSEEMEQDELNMLGGEILAVKSADWILEFCVDELEDYYKITGEDQYGKTSTESPFSPAPKPEELGFIRRVDALISGRKYMKNPDRKQDIQDYVTVIYAYRGEESRFYELYSTYPKVIDKFK